MHLPPLHPWVLTAPLHPSFLNASLWLLLCWLQLRNTLKFLPPQNSLPLTQCFSTYYPVSRLCSQTSPKSHHACHPRARRLLTPHSSPAWLLSTLAVKVASLWAVALKPPSALRCPPGLALPSPSSPHSLPASVTAPREAAALGSRTARGPPWGRHVLGHGNPPFVSKAGGGFYFGTRPGPR